MPDDTRERNPLTAPSLRWQDITPEDAAGQKIDLTERLDITAPLNENGERCPWPWEPQQLVGAPLGQYRCPYCYAMCVAGMEHFDYTGDTFAEGGPGEAPQRHTEGTISE